MRVTICLILVFCCAGCIHYRTAYYVSPVNGLSDAYATVPLQSDSLKFACYLNTAFSAGSANDERRDKSFSFQTSFTAANNFKNFQAHYGSAVLLGNYRLGNYDNAFIDPSVNPQILDQYKGNHFFGAAAFNGGLNTVVDFRGGEWRIIGIETFLCKEFGDYLTIRKQLPDSAATFINPSSFFGTLGGYTEILAKTKEGSLGFKFSTGTVLGKMYHHVPYILNYAYSNFTFNATIKKWAPYLQLDFAPKGASVLFGLNYRLGK